MNAVTAPQGRRPQARPQQGRPRPGSGRPLPRGDSLYTPGASDARRRLERASARPLVWLQQMPRWIPPIVAAAVLVTGLAVPGAVGAVALLLVAAFLGWLAALSWPKLSPSGRLLRLAAVAGVVALALIQAFR
jgi:hypothetical protein